MKLKRTDGQQLENYMTFAVRDDSSTAPVLYSLDVTTWQAYNYWGGSGNNNTGYSLYGRFNDITGDSTGSRAFTVSFDRPYADGSVDDGAGKLLRLGLPDDPVHGVAGVRHDVRHLGRPRVQPEPALDHRVFVNAGHDEYYSDNMRAHIQNAITNGVDMAFFSANNFYYRITVGRERSRRRVPPDPLDKNALAGSTHLRVAALCRRQRPENEIGGVMLQGVANDRPFLVSDANSWIYAGTGLHTYTGNGHEQRDHERGQPERASGHRRLRVRCAGVDDAGLSAYVAFEPAGLATVGHSFVPASDGNASNTWSDATLYTRPGGGTVFAAGTIQWSWGVDTGYNDGYCGCSPGTYQNTATQRITSNIINRFIGP